MKPCSQNRERIAHLSVDLLDPQQELELREHVKGCEGCRTLLTEMTALTRRLSAVEPRRDIQTSARFHQRLRNAVRAENKSSQPTAPWFDLWTRLFNWRIALPLAGTALVLLAFLHDWHPRPTPFTARVAPPVVAIGGSEELEPTLSNYQMVANRSFEQLDQILTRQAGRNPAPELVYTPSAFARAAASD